MKLSGILIASVTAQQARQRENKEDVGFTDYSFGGADDAFSSLYDSFGGDDAFGGFDMSAFNDYGFGSTAAPTMAVATDAPDYGFDLGDAFGDASDSDAAADYQNTVAADYDGADDLGSIRPSEDDEVKSNFVVDTGAGTAETNLFGDTTTGQGSNTNEVQDLTSIDIELNNGLAQRCFVGSAANSNVNQGLDINAAGVVHDWFTNGVWDICDGENDTCEIKVVRRKDVIQQIHSKCANRHSCVDNMRQNFNPEGASPGGYAGNIYHTWTHQACRPRWLSNYPDGARWNARQMTRDSVCFFCVEPCRTQSIWQNNGASASDMQAAECVGRSGENVWNAAPIPGSTFKLFDDCSDGTNSATCTRKIEEDYGQTTWDTNAPKNNNDGSGPNMKKLNFYSVIDNVMLYNTEKFSNHKMSLMQDVSRIQYAQINARDSLDFMTDAVDTTNPELFSICEGGYCYSDDEALGQSVASRANLAQLFSGTYSRAATAPSGSTTDFVIEIVADAPVNFDSLSFKKVDGAANDYADLYKNVCVEIIDNNGDMATGFPMCTDETYGFSDNSISATASADATEAIVFTTGSTITNIKTARIIFDTSATGSDALNSNADYDLNNAVQIKELSISTS